MGTKPGSSAVWNSKMLLVEQCIECGGFSAACPEREQVRAFWQGSGRTLRAQGGTPASWEAQPDPHACAGDSAIAATNRGKQTNEALGLNLAAINI